MNKRLLNSKDVRSTFGNASQMTLWRWLNDESLNFPKPLLIRSRRYWDAEQIEAFRSRMLRDAVNHHAS